MAKKIIVINNPLNQEWYESLIEDLSSLKVEKNFSSRWSILEFYHELGTRLINERIRFEESGIDEASSTKRVSQSLSMTQRSVQLAIQFAQKYPDINELPDGKAISWHRIVKDYLPEKKEKLPLPQLPATNTLQERIIKHSLTLAQNAKVTKEGIVLILSNDME